MAVEKRVMNIIIVQKKYGERNILLELGLEMLLNLEN